MCEQSHISFHLSSKYRLTSCSACPILQSWMQQHEMATSQASTPKTRGHLEQQAKVAAKQVRDREQHQAKYRAAAKVCESRCRGWKPSRGCELCVALTTLDDKAKQPQCFVVSLTRVWSNSEDTILGDQHESLHCV
jgi:hypothetical protein